MTTTRVVPVPALRLIVAGALRAPSVHNTQPWRWHATSRTLELHADRSRGLPATDPEGRNLVISCGAALHHAQVVARALGWATHVDRHPDPDDPDLLARLEQVSLAVRLVTDPVHTQEHLAQQPVEVDLTQRLTGSPCHVVLCALHRSSPWCRAPR